MKSYQIQSSKTEKKYFLMRWGYTWCFIMCVYISERIASKACVFWGHAAVCLISVSSFIFPSDEWNDSRLTDEQRRETRLINVTCDAYKESASRSVMVALRPQRIRACVCVVCVRLCVSWCYMARWELRKFTVINGLHDNTEWLNYLIGSEPVVKWRFNCGVERLIHVCCSVSLWSAAACEFTDDFLSPYCVFRGTGYQMQACAAY